MSLALSSAEPEWAYHWLFLHHSLNTSVNTFDRLITFASQREDQHIVDAVRVMRLQWNLSASRYHASVADYHFLDAHDKSAWPRTLRLYFATLKVAFLAYFSDEKGTLEKTKAALGELHGFFSDASLEAPADAPSSSRPDGTFEVSQICSAFSCSVKTDVGRVVPSDPHSRQQPRTAASYAPVPHQPPSLRLVSSAFA